jgi:hypothetical protein
MNYSLQEDSGMQETRKDQKRDFQAEALRRRRFDFDAGPFDRLSRDQAAERPIPRPVIDLGFRGIRHKTTASGLSTRGRHKN